MVFFNSGYRQYPAIITRVNQDSTADMTVFTPEAHAQHRCGKEGILSGNWSKEARKPSNPPPLGKEKIDSGHNFNKSAGQPNPLGTGPSKE
jgi:hypothetical protein